MPAEFHGKYIPRMTSEQLEAYRRLPVTNQPTRDPTQAWETSKVPHMPEHLKGLYQEVLPSAPGFRNRLKEIMERRDMMRRRRALNIPEFYVGSILAVTISDKTSSDRKHRFVGICIERDNAALWSSFVLRNVVENQPVEIKYELYNPTLLEIDVLRLERRLDNNLWYLRDAPKEYSYVPFDIGKIPHATGDPIALNDTKVPLNPRPWIFHWALHGYRGIEEDSLYGQLSPKELVDIEGKMLHTDRFDLMKSYLANIPAADQETAFKDIFLQHKDLLEFQEEEHQKEVLRLRRR